MASATEDDVVVPLSKTDVYPLWRSLRTVEEMAVDRGYKRNRDDWELYTTTKDSDESPVTEKAFGKVHADTLNDPETTRKNLRFRFLKDDKITLTTFWKNSLGTNDIQEILEAMKEDGVTRAIVVYAVKITPYAATALRNLRIQKIIIETFSEAEMQYNVSKHEDVPRHIICSAAKKASVLKEYSATQDQISQIKISDPVCRYYGAVKGQMIKVVRPSDCTPVVITTTGEKKALFDIFYRIVV